jgi:hypothetical protein
MEDQVNRLVEKTWGKLSSLNSQLERLITQSSKIPTYPAIKTSLDSRLWNSGLW